MPSGRKERVVISCVTFETSKITDPIIYYEATKVHLIHYTSPSNKRNRIYNEFYEQVCKLIRENLPEAKIVEHIETVFDFTAMLRTVLKILRTEENADVFVNTSAGTSEYTAASVIASMMVSNSIPFSVGTKEWTIPNDEIKDRFYRDGVPVGLTSATRPPRVLPRYRIDVPEEHLVAGLRIMDEKNRKDEPTSGTFVINSLKKNGIWYRKERSKDTDIEKKRYDSVCYQRDFVDKWKELGWIKKDKKTNKYYVTEEGEIVLDTFFVDE
ncbi:MAG: DUF6293 family protein [Methanomassiliicoccaceae archaeon]|nr:DUF6293 family protein [Methanomassiliicoccaceae archaeon]